MWGARFNEILRGPFQRLSKNAAKLLAATVFLAGAGTGLYYVTSVESGPVGGINSTERHDQ